MTRRPNAKARRELVRVRLAHQSKRRGRVSWWRALRLTGLWGSSVRRRLAAGEPIETAEYDPGPLYSVARCRVEHLSLRASAVVAWEADYDDDDDEVEPKGPSAEAMAAAAEIRRILEPGRES